MRPCETGKKCAIANERTCPICKVIDTKKTEFELYCEANGFDPKKISSYYEDGTK